MRIKLAPSIMCADYAGLEREIRDVEKVGADIIHFDVMDGHYVSNFVGDAGLVKALHGLTNLPLDIHLMCLEPERYLDIFPLRPGDGISFHPETSRHPHRLVESIRSRACLAGAAIRTDLPAGAMEELAPELDYFTVMTIDAGMPGTAFRFRALEKIAKVKDMAKAGGREIFAQVDGSVRPDNAAEIVGKGADVLILGYPGCFDRELGTVAAMGRIRDVIGKICRRE
ncbi:MAG: ribulose-phosphate 3-epimerase [Planctomycetota bacterium]|jgi:ribulose-phosphate 3-epimerase|nr:ribulose-phosphate 3-epimerase [Planctomycetota bacterium]